MLKCGIMTQAKEGTKLKDLEGKIGRELGVVRVSLGLGSCWEDVEAFLEFVRDEVAGLPLGGNDASVSSD